MKFVNTLGYTKINLVFFFASLTCVVHGLILSSNIVGLKKIAESCVNGRSQQSLSYFINNTKSAVFELLHSVRLSIQLRLANKLKPWKYSFFIIDDFLFKKNKRKKTQGAGYNYHHEANKAIRSQCVVSSSILINGFHIPFKHMFYVGEKYICKKKFKKKTNMAADLISRFNRWALDRISQPIIALVDGGYTCQQIIESISDSNRFRGFIGRFSKGRNVKTENYSGLLKDYIKKLDIKTDFKSFIVLGKEKLAHVININLNYGKVFKLVIVLDDPSNIESTRPLITNMLDLSVEMIIEYYSYRWKEETYHQVIKDAFFARTHKFRKLKTLTRYLEIINVAYGLCEQRRWSKYGGEMTIFDIKNELVEIESTRFILNVKGGNLSKASKEAVLKRFRR